MKGQLQSPKNLSCRSDCANANGAAHREPDGLDASTKLGITRWRLRM